MKLKTKRNFDTVVNILIDLGGYDRFKASEIARKIFESVKNDKDGHTVEYFLMKIIEERGYKEI